MRWLLLCALFVLGCGTNMPVQDQGAIDLHKTDSNGKELAPLVIQYNLKIPNDRHEIFFLDENKKRFNLKVDGKTDTTKGIVVYLPTDRYLALSSILHVNPTRSTDFGFEDENKDLDLFKLKKGVVNYFGYFELNYKNNSNRFSLYHAHKRDRDIYIEEMKKKYGLNDEAVNVVNK